MDCIKTTKMRFCMHAGGMIQGEMLTNTVEAYRYWHGRGKREFEFDICRTIDGEYVTSHNLDHSFFQKHGIKEMPEELTSEWFVSQDIFFNGRGPFHAMNLSEVLYALSRGEIECVMLDPKDFSYEGTLLLLNCLQCQLAKHDIQPKKIIVELYNADMIAASRKYPLLATYQYCVDDDIQQGNSIETRCLPNEELVNYLIENNIRVVSYPWKQAVENLPLLKKLSDGGFVIYSRTRNNIFQELLEQTGVSVNIVDTILSGEEALTLQPYKTQYMEKYRDRVNQIFK